MQQISVIMPVWNAQDYLSQAIESILSQTYQNFELIIVDDCSSDSSYEIAASFTKKSSKIKLLKNAWHRGVSATANKACLHATGQFIARMDADDISVPDRLQKQLVFLQTHPDMIAVGGQFVLINKHTLQIGKRTFPLSHKDIYPYAFYFTGLSQPGLMINRNHLPKNFRFYNETLPTAEEVELVFKLFSFGPVANLPDTILYYRIHDTNTSLKNPKQTFFLTLRSRIQAIVFLGYIPSFKGMCINLLQILIVGLLPNRLIVHVYRLFRDNPVNPSFSLESAGI